MLRQWLQEWQITSGSTCDTHGSVHSASGENSPIFRSLRRSRRSLDTCKTSLYVLLHTGSQSQSIIQSHSLCHMLFQNSSLFHTVFAFTYHKGSHSLCHNPLYTATHFSTHTLTSWVTVLSRPSTLVTLLTNSSAGMWWFEAFSGTSSSSSSSGTLPLL